MASYVTYWSKEHIEYLNRKKDNGPLSVIFGGPHIRMPSIGKIRIGDYIYPITITGGQIYIMAKLLVKQIINADDYINEYLGVDILELSIGKAMPTKPYKCHQIPQTCCAKLAAIGDGTTIEARPFPQEQLPLLMFGAKKGKEKHLKMKDNKASCINFSGSIRRLSEESEKLFLQVFLDENNKE